MGRVQAILCYRHTVLRFSFIILRGIVLYIFNFIAMLHTSIGIATGYWYCYRPMAQYYWISDTRYIAWYRSNPILFINQARHNAILLGLLVSILTHSQRSGHCICYV